MTTMNRDGISTCPPGQEQYEILPAVSFRGKVVWYDYRTLDGVLFSCVSQTLEHARARRDAWLADQKPDYDKQQEDSRWAGRDHKEFTE